MSAHTAGTPDIDARCGAVEQVQTRRGRILEKNRLKQLRQRISDHKAEEEQLKELLSQAEVDAAASFRARDPIGSRRPESRRLANKSSVMC